MTRTFSTANVVISPWPNRGPVWVEDFSYMTPDKERPDRRYTDTNPDAFIALDWPIDGAHSRRFATMHEASVWLWERGAVIGDLFVEMDHDEYDLDFQI